VSNDFTMLVAASRHLLCEIRPRQRIVYAQHKSHRNILVQDGARQIRGGYSGAAQKRDGLPAEVTFVTGVAAPAELVGAHSFFSRYSKDTDTWRGGKEVSTI
jgi:hypothetical protein